MMQPQNSPRYASLRKAPTAAQQNMVPLTIVILLAAATFVLSHTVVRRQSSRLRKTPANPTLVAPTAPEIYMINEQT